MSFLIYLPVLIIGSVLLLITLFLIIIPYYDNWVLNRDFEKQIDESEKKGFESMSCDSIDSLYYNKYKDTILKKPHHWDIIQKRHFECIEKP